MTTLPIPGGFSNKEAVDLAYLSIGLSDAMFGRTAEEYAAGVALLRAMMGEWPFDQLGFDDSVASIEEESGVDRKWLTAVGYSLGERIGATIGKVFTPGSQRTKSRAFSQLCASIPPPEMQMAAGTISGAGARGASTFFPEAS